MATEAQYLAVRDIIQYILVPIIFVIGFLGNALSIVVLTRKRMRCSTNIYLTGLAVADIVYLTMVLIMSAPHYKPTAQVAIFWRCRGLFQWLIDGSSYISLWIVVCFTIERYIAVCHPMKGQVFCTEDRAKKVLGIIVFVILLSILSENFEYEIVENDQYRNLITGEKCNLPKVLPLSTNQTEILLTKNSNFNDVLNQQNQQLQQQQQQQIITTTTQKINIPDNQYYYGSSKETLKAFVTDFENIFDENSKRIRQIRAAQNLGIENVEVTTVSNNTNTSLNDCKFYMRTYTMQYSTLGNDHTYRTVFDIFTIIFYSLLPLILIIIFNTLLIITVHKSNRLRNKMANMSVRQIKQQQQENKITTILIAVVILFTVCQTPWAIYLFVENFTDFMDEYSKKICGNIFNTLVAIDAASNFILYCLLSDKYRKTLKELIMGRKNMRQDTLISRQGTLASSWYNYSYKSFKKQHPDNTNGNGGNKTQQQNQGNRKSINTQRKPLSSFQPPQTPIDDEISKNRSVSVSGSINNNNNNNKNRNPSRMSSSFNHKLPNNDKRLLLRPTVSFHNHPLSLKSSSTPSTPPTQISRDADSAVAVASTTPPSINIEENVKNTSENGTPNRLRQDSIVSISEYNNNNNNNHNNVNITNNNLLKPSDSCGSLQRSQSLILQSKPKHSPDCPNFDGNF